MPLLCLIGLQFYVRNDSVVHIDVLTGLLFTAARSSCGIWPHARAGVLVEVKPCWTRDFRGVTLYTVVEHVAHTLVGMREVTVPPRTQVIGFRLLCKHT